MEELVRRGSDWRQPEHERQNKQEEPLPNRPATFKILCPTLACVTRATAELSSFHGVSPQEVAGVASDVKCSPVVALSTPENQQAVDGDNQLGRWSTYVRSTGLI
jgi:hypothetical protein